MDSHASAAYDDHRSPRTQFERSAEARLRMLRAATKICATGGFEGLTLAEVGTAAGYSRGLPAHHFGSKAGLASALLEHLTTGFDSWFQANRPDSPLAAIEFAASAYLRGARRNPIGWQALLNVLGHSLTGNPFGLDLTAVTERSIAAFRDMVEEGKAAGEIDVDQNSVIQATILLSSLRGLAATILADADLPVDDLVATFTANVRCDLSKQRHGHAE